MPQGEGTYGSKVGRPPKKNSPSPMGYSPFRMKAADHGNSPMKKNYGEFGVGTPEAPKKAEKAAASAAPEEDATAETAAAEDAAAGAEAAEGGGEVAPHGPEAHTGGAGPIGKRKGGLAGIMAGFRRGGMMGAGGRQGRGMQKKIFGGLFSDVRLKENIERTGVSASGIPTYEFNYIGSNNRYSGAMAQDLLEINPGAVTMDSSGYYKVNYNDIDVDMHQINN